jgi:hypothetical protein
MKFMLMMQGTCTGWESMRSWSADDFKAHIAFMKDLNKKLAAAGELVSAEGLDFPSRAKIVRANGNSPTITDGPFPETKEFLAGYWIVDVETIERALEIAATASAAPGKNGTPVNIPIEVRQVMSAPPSEPM